MATLAAYWGYFSEAGPVARVLAGCWGGYWEVVCIARLLARIIAQRLSLLLQPSGIKNRTPCVVHSHVYILVAKPTCSAVGVAQTKQGLRQTTQPNKMFKDMFSVCLVFERCQLSIIDVVILESTFPFAPWGIFDDWLILSRCLAHHVSLHWKRFTGVAWYWDMR